MDPVLPRHARRQPGRVRAADVGRLKTAGDCVDAVSDADPESSRCALALALSSRKLQRGLTVQAFPSTGRRWQVSSAGGHQPLWGADGRELFFVSDERRSTRSTCRRRTASSSTGVPSFLHMRANVFNMRNSYIPNRMTRFFLVNTPLQ